MSWARCAKCRTFIDASREARCFACGETTGGPGATRLTAPPVDRKVKSDSTGSVGIFAFILTALTVGLFAAMPRPANCSHLVAWLIGVTLVATMLLALGLTWRRERAGQVMMSIATVLLFNVCIVAAFFAGILILIFMSCGRWAT